MSFTYGRQGGARLTVEFEDGEVFSDLRKATFGLRNYLDNGGYTVNYIELPPEQIALLIEYLEKERNGTPESN